jgi:hypothetical protein
MLRPTLSRFHVVTMVAAVLGTGALAWGNVALLGAVVVALLTAIGLGVAIPQLRLFGPFVCRGAGSRRCLALTFDDGPDARSTPALLELLREAGVEAAFSVPANEWRRSRIWRRGSCARDICWKIILSRTAMRRISSRSPVCKRSWRRRKRLSSGPRAWPRVGFGRRWACRIRACFAPRGRWD